MLLVAGGLSLVGFVAPFNAATTRIDASNLQLDFSGERSIGEKATAGFTVRYSEVATSGSTVIDAILTVNKVNNIDFDDDFYDGADNIMDYVDEYLGDESDSYIWSYFDIAGEGPGFFQGEVEIQIDFVESGTTSPVILENLEIATLDIDSSQYTQFAGITGYELERNTVLAVQTRTQIPSLARGVYRFAELQDDGSDYEDEENWAIVHYSAISSVVITAGATDNGGMSMPFAIGNYLDIQDSTVVEVQRPVYKITYSGNGTTIGVPKVSYGRDVITISAPGFLTRAGYAFVGWNTKADGTGTAYEPGDAVVLSDDMNLYAIWQVNPVVEPEPAVTYETKILRQTVYFASGSSVLSAKAKAQLRALVRKVPKKAIEPNVSVTGFVQATKVTANDRSLSRARARNVGKFMRAISESGAWYEAGLGRSTKQGAKARKVVVVIEYQVAVR